MTTIEQQPLDIDTVLRTLTADVPQAIHIETQPARSARYQSLNSPLPAPLGAAVRANGIQRLYTHQAEAIERVRAGEHIAVVTATASGKSLCYQLPVLEALLNDPAGFCFYLAPTKALGHDQLRSLHRLLEHLPDIRAATFDGDTPKTDRDALRQESHILLTNPDMLHRSILPAHNYGWQDALSKLRFLVIDEVHTLVGTFGTHVAFIIRRLLRLAHHYGANPQIIAASATSANPKDHVEALTGQPVALIENDGAPRGERHVVFWQPPLLDVVSGPDGEKKRKSATSESAVVWTRLIGLGVKTLAFTSSRRGAELLQKLARTALERQHPEAAARIATYRAGYSPEDRKDLEQRFISGDLIGLASTNALELGIDIGSLDAVVLCGYPGRQAAAWQQIGRAGRSQSTSLAVLVATDDAIDQFYVQHPQRFFAAPIEQARVALDNSYVAAEQLVCAAFELPLDDEDTVFGPAYERLRAWLLRQKRLVRRGGDVVSANRWPARDVSIRSIWSDSVELINSGPALSIWCKISLFVWSALTWSRSKQLHGQLSHRFIHRRKKKQP
jgi:DEAD/DEAH box helicase domain-containing protein